jgi:hypothetical protein
MACDAKTYHGLTDVMMRGIRIDLHQMGMSLPDGDQGIIVNQEYGVQVEFIYSNPELVLTVRIVEKPFFVPCSLIYGRLDQAIERRKMGHDPMKGQ